MRCLLCERTWSVGYDGERQSVTAVTRTDCTRPRSGPRLVGVPQSRRGRRRGRCAPGVECGQRARRCCRRALRPGDRRLPLRRQRQATEEQERRPRGPARPAGSTPRPTCTPGTSRVTISEPMSRLIGSADPERAEAGHLQLEDRAARGRTAISSSPVMFTGRI